MHSPLDRVRARLEAFRGTEAALVLAQLEGTDADGATRAASLARAALGTGENRADLDEARSAALLVPGSETLLVSHLADAAAAEAIARARVPAPVGCDAEVIFEGRKYTLDALVREGLEARGDVRVPRLRAACAVIDRDRASRAEALAAADEARSRVLARGPASADQAKPEAAQLQALPDRAQGDLGDRCATFLAATDEVAIELGARLVHARGGRGEEPLTALLGALAALGGPSVWRKADHGPIVTALLRPLALDGPLSRGVRLASHTLATFDVEVIVRAGMATAVHTPVHVLGVVSRLLAVEGCVRALAVALAPASAAFEVRVPASGASLAWALGSTLAAGLCAPAVLVRSIGLDSVEGRSEALAATLALLLTARVRATRALSVRDRPDDEEARSRGARALGLREPLATAELAFATTHGSPAIDAACRASLVGLSATAALRERFDVDWARNPRVEHLIRAASDHGAALSAERWLTELGGRIEDAATFGRGLAGA